jgi:signal transduction histidine kinase
MSREMETFSAESRYQLRLLDLRFADGDTENRFTADHLSRALPAIRIFVLAACLLYASFGVLDAYVIPEIKRTAWLIRYVGVCPVLIGVFLLTYTSAFVRVAQLALSAMMLTSGLGIIAMTALADAPGKGLYYAGLIMVVIYGSSLVRLRCINAAGLSLALLAVYQAVAIWINPIPKSLLLSNDFFLGMSVAVGIFSSYVQEWYIRRDFVSAEMVLQEKARSDRLRVDAEAANRAKGDFLAVMSHEFRTPLNAILGFSEVIQQRIFGPVGSERYASYVDDIHQAAEHLLDIITDILDLSKAEMGKLTLHEGDVDLWAALDQSLRLVREKAAEQGLRLSVAAPTEEMPRIRGDLRLLKQVFVNLLGNAIKFTPTGGAIAVAVEGSPESGWQVRVSDTGIGIAEADLRRIMEPFVQVQSAFARGHGGAGLGLPLVKKIMNLHEGDLTITSTLGGGTTVVARFPAGRTIRSAWRAIAAGAA